MSPRHAATSLSAALLLALPGVAAAKNGGAEGAPATAPPTAAPCVSAVAKGSGTVHGNKAIVPTFELTNCSSADEVVVPHYSDHAYDAFGLGRDCGPDQSWTGAPVSLPARKTVTVTTFAVRAHCPAAEAHTITATFTTPAGGAVSGIGYFGWTDSIKP